MQRIVFLFVLCLLAAACFRQVEKTIVVQVPQLTASSCTRPIQEALAKVEGVRTAQFDVTNHTVTVTYNSEKLGIRNVEFTIANAGFKANEVPANETARAKLPEECR